MFIGRVENATTLTSKLSVREEKDKNIQNGYEKSNNENLSKYSKDKDVHIGSKSKNKFWVGFKKHVCPKTGAILADKGYVGAINRLS